MGDSVFVLHGASLIGFADCIVELLC